MKRRLAVGAGVLALLFVVGVGVLLVRDARAAEDHLRRAEVALADARSALVAGEVEASQTPLATAEEAVRGADVRTDGVLWDLAAAVPRFGVSAEAARTTVDLADAATELGRAASEEAAGLLAAGPATFVGDDGVVRTSELGQVAEVVGELPLEPLADARDELVALPESGMVGPVAAGRQRAVALADDTIATLTRGRDTLGALAGFLGADGDRRYLLGVQNPGELRGTGGLLSYLAELRVVDGRLSVRPASIEVSDDPEDLVARLSETGSSLQNLEPVDRPDAFADRYDHIAGGAILQSVNADPDLPTVAPVLRDLYSARSGRPTVDGVVLVDPAFLAALLPVTGGPIELPDALVADAPGMPTTLTQDNLVEALTVTVYDSFGGTNPGRRAYDEAVTLAALNRLSAGDWDPVAVVRALADAAAGRHLQLWSADPEEQATFLDLGLAGAMPNAERGHDGDLLAVTGINAAANKQDTLVSHRISGTVELGPVQESAPPRLLRDASLTVALTNPVEPGRDTYISGATTTGEGREDSALNRTWFSVWTHPTTRALEVRQDGIEQPYRATQIHGHRVFDYYLETPSDMTDSFRIDLEGPVELTRDGDEMVYELLLWRQAKAIPDHWDLTLTAPPGWDVAEAVVTGGGDPADALVMGDGGQPLTATVEDGDVHLGGAATRDATLTVRLERGA